MMQNSNQNKFSKHSRCQTRFSLNKIGFCYCSDRGIFCFSHYDNAFVVRLIYKIHETPQLIQIISTSCILRFWQLHNFKNDVILLMSGLLPFHQRISQSNLKKIIKIIKWKFKQHTKTSIYNKCDLRKLSCQTYAL